MSLHGRRLDAIPAADRLALEALGAYIYPVGSRMIAGAARASSDHDFLVWAPKRTPETFSGLGYEMDRGDRHYDPAEGDFNSWRKGDVNLIVTADVIFCTRFRAAQALAEARKLVHREDRVTLFRAVLYGRGREEVEDVASR